MELAILMREDLMSVYREVYTSCHSQEEAYRKVVHHPAKRFYVTPKHAWERLRLMAKGDFSVLDRCTDVTRRMYLELFRQLQQLSQRKEFIGKSLWFICPFLVSQPAPEFYMDERTFKLIFNTMKKYGKDFRYSKICEDRKKRSSR